MPLIIIPARLGATRLPNKPLADIGGVPMIVRCWRQVIAAAAGDVVVATDSAAIAEVIGAAGGRAVMTPETCQSGTDRVHAAAQLLDPSGAHDIVVNVQGDQPDVAPEAISAVLRPMAEPAVDIATVAAIITDPAEVLEPAVVKLVGAPIGGNGDILRALYFTRGIAPSGPGPLYHHIGIYAYRRAALARFVALPPSVLELRERLEQLRALEAGMRIDACLVRAIPLSVDTPADLERARRLLAP